MSARWLVPILFAAACSHGSRVETGEPTGTTPRAEKSDGGVAPTATNPTNPSNPTNPIPPDPSAVTPAQPPPNVRIMVRTSPAKAVVYWGKKKLGLTPLNFDRPRDSGPVDLVIRSSGYFPVHTRAYTVKNDLIGVKMVKLADRMTIFGAKAELPPEEPPPAPGVPAPGVPAPGTQPVVAPPP